MAAYVIKSWKATQVPHDEAGAYVRIVGRAGGFFSWLLAQLGIDPTVSITVLQDKVLFEQGSLSGSVKRVIPMSKMSSTFYGYTKPWKQALVVGIVFGLLTFWMLFLGALAGLVYYYLNKTLTLGIVEVSGVVSSIEFKRSVIEGQRIDEPEARGVCDIVESLLDRHQEPRYHVA
jgi:hypothetical protein